MSLDDIYALATSSTLFTAELDEEDVLVLLDEHCDAAAVSNFELLQMKYEPVNGDVDPERLLIAPVACPDGRFMGVVFTIAADPGNEGEWLTTWRAVRGPLTMDELKALDASLRRR